MNKKNVVVTMCGFLFFSSFCSELLVPLPSKKNIEQYKKSMHRDCKKGRMLGYGMWATAFLFSSYVVYRLFRKEKTFDKKVLNNKELTKKLLRLEEKYNQHFKIGLFNHYWMQEVGRNSISIFLSAGIAQAMLKPLGDLYNHYNCFDSLELFTKTRLSEGSFAEFINGLRAFKYRGYKFCDRFVTSYKNLVFNVENIIAFMEYKKDFYAEKGFVLSVQEGDIAAELYAVAYKFFETVNGLLKDNNHDEIFESTAIFKQDLENYSAIFSRAEKRIDWLLKT